MRNEEISRSIQAVCDACISRPTAQMILTNYHSPDLMTKATLQRRLDQRTGVIPPLTPGLIKYLRRHRPGWRPTSFSYQLPPQLFEQSKAIKASKPEPVSHKSEDQAKASQMLNELASLLHGKTSIPPSLSQLTAQAAELSKNISKLSL